MTEDRPVGEQLGHPGHRFYIVCNDCHAKLEGDQEYLLAMFGPQGLTDEEAVLVCVPWNERSPAFWFRSIQAVCDGCGMVVAAAPSSLWFIEAHLLERV